MRARNHTNPFNIRHRFEKLNLEGLFPKQKDNLCYEIGFGRGVFLRYYAEKNPMDKIVGIEVRKSIADILNQRLRKKPQDNIHIAHGNGEIGLEDFFEDESLDKVFVFHPDPWFKKKHNKRRVINPKFLEVLKMKLNSTGKLYITTDVEILWEAMLETIEESKLFKKTEDTDFWKNNYISHWDTFSEKERRNQFKGVYTKIK